MNTKFLSGLELQEIIKTHKHWYKIKGNNNNLEWVWHFYLGENYILEVLEVESNPMIELDNNNGEYKSLCNLRIAVGLMKEGNYIEYKKLFDDMTNTNNILPVQEINKQLGITEEEGSMLLKTFDEKYESEIEGLRKISLEKLKKELEEQRKDIDRAYS